jgi:two-component system NtrC family sensor kinase
MRATNLLHSLLRFAEGDTVQEHLSDYTEIIFSLADDIERVLDANGIRLELEIPPLPVTAVPRAQLDTVLRHIVQNAIDAMPQGGVLGIDGSLENGRLITRICDTGRGMTEEEMSHLFEPFFSTKGELGSTTRAPGLGLAVAHGIVQFLGGSITASSTPGKGTLFTVIIPVLPTSP